MIRRPLCVYCVAFSLVVFVVMQILTETGGIVHIPGVGPVLYEGCATGKADIDRTVLSPDEPQDKKELEVVGKIARIEERKAKSEDEEDKVHFRLKTEYGMLLCYFPYDESLLYLHIGQMIRVRGKVRFFDRASNPGQFDSWMYYKTQGIEFAVSGCELLQKETVAGKYMGYTDVLYAIRRRCSHVLDSCLPAQEAGIMKAMLLGERGSLSDEIKGLFQRNGISHILAISGLHISFFGMALYSLLKRIGVKRIVAGAVAMFLVVSFGLMTVQGASSIRSILMFGMFLGAEFFLRVYDLQTSMAFSAVVLLCMQPLYVLQSSFQFSFGAIVGISVIYPSLCAYLKKENLSERMITDKSVKEKRVEKLREYMKTSVLTSLSVTLAILPVQLCGYASVPLYSCFLNPLVIGLLTIVMSSGIIGVLLGCVWTVLGRIALFPGFLVLKTYEVLCGLFDKLPMANFCFGAPKPWQVIVYYLLLFGWAFYTQYACSPEHKGRWNMPRHLCLVPAIAVFLLMLRLRFYTSCTMLDVGQGDGLVVKERTGYNIMIDGGSTDVSNVGTYRLIPYLQHEGVRHVDYAFVSHADSDHTNGLIELLKDSDCGVKVETVVLSKFAETGAGSYGVSDAKTGAESYGMGDAKTGAGSYGMGDAKTGAGSPEDNPYKDVIDAATQAGCKILYIRAGDTFHLGDVTLWCVYPGSGETAEGNDQSEVLMMQVDPPFSKGYRMLFTGDLTSLKEAQVLQNMSALNISSDIDILKCGHHGSQYSSEAAFLEALSPELTLISAGRDNSYGHPHAEVLERMEAVGCNVCRTDRDGALTILVKD
ncbi:MAG: DNA internalization-related competence protein ComEC/Rec2 [Lachnospiraceae bacterium]|nr:DNA internalization-related competence protein ComEC/Rec2 [Lachnospiraceae bacterium]